MTSTNPLLIRIAVTSVGFRLRRVLLAELNSPGGVG